jgi:hypothetical protein
MTTLSGTSPQLLGRTAVDEGQLGSRLSDDLCVRPA